MNEDRTDMEEILGEIDMALSFEDKEATRQRLLDYIRARDNKHPKLKSCELVREDDKLFVVETLLVDKKDLRTRWVWAKDGMREYLLTLGNFKPSDPEWEKELGIEKKDV